MIFFYHLCYFLPFCLSFPFATFREALSSLVLLHKCRKSRSNTFPWKNGSCTLDVWQYEVCLKSPNFHRRSFFRSCPTRIRRKTLTTLDETQVMAVAKCRVSASRTLTLQTSSRVAQSISTSSCAQVSFHFPTRSKPRQDQLFTQVISVPDPISKSFPRPFNFQVSGGAPLLPLFPAPTLSYTLDLSRTNLAC